MGHRRSLLAITTFAVLVMGACSAQTERPSQPADSGGSAADASGDTTGCNGRLSESCVDHRIQPFCCPLGAECVSPDYCDLGDGGCVPWACPADAAVTDGSCNGTPIPSCYMGVTTTFCCPLGADCSVPPYCDLGGGTCAPGSCNPVDASTSDRGAAE